MVVKKKLSKVRPVSPKVTSTRTSTLDPLRKKRVKAKSKLRASELFKSESRFYNGSDVAETDSFDAQIERVTLEAMPDGKEKVALWLTDHEKGVVCNVTNGLVLADSFGDEMEQWPGYWVQVSTELKRNPSTGKTGPAIVLQPADAPDDSSDEEDDEPFDDEEDET